MGIIGTPINASRVKCIDITNLFALMPVGNVWYGQDRFGNNALNTNIVSVDNHSFVQIFARSLIEQLFIFNRSTI